MKPEEKSDFLKVLSAVYALYRTEYSAPVAGIWWQTMQGFELAAIRDALGRHAMNPDTGQFLPKPADVVRQIDGTTTDTALLAWSKVLGALKSAGTYDSVVFDDPIIHRVVSDLGGWVWLGRQDEREMPFVEKRFRDAYRAWKAQGLLEYPHRLAGIIEHQNGAAGFAGEHVPTKLIGERSRALTVLEGPRQMLEGLAA